MQLYISYVMKKILEPISERYLKDVDVASQMSAQEIYDYLINECIRKNEILPVDKGTIIFGTPGCSHNIRKGIHCGCSFCDWNDSYVVNPAYVVVLRKKSSELYQRMQVKTLEILRGSNISSEVFEEYAIHDCFDSSQISNEEIAILLSEKNFKKFPSVGLVQVRAESVTTEKIQLWKKGAKRFLTLGMGVETGDEWIRNHWLNKDLSDSSIKKAIDVAHSNQCKITANLLMMIPGITLKQSLYLLISSIKKVIDMGCDSVMISPLVNKRYTIQYFLNHQSNKYDNFYYVLHVIECISELESEYRDKIMLSNVNFTDYFTCINKENGENKIASEYFFPLLQVGGMKNFTNFIQKMKEVIEGNDYLKFLEAFETLDGTECLQEQIKKSAHVLLMKLFDNVESKYLDELFKHELEYFGGNYAEI